MVRLYNCIVAPLFLVTFAGYCFGAMVATKPQLEGHFWTNVQGKIVYVKESDNSAYFVDFSTTPYLEQKISNQTPVNSPLISPNGRWVTFGGGAAGSEKVYACSLGASVTPREIASGFDPHWWTDPASHRVYLIYSTVSGLLNWPQPGATMKQEIDTVTFNKIGSPATLLANSFNGGLSKNGRFLCTSYESVDLYDLALSRHYGLNGGIQACNSSINPTEDTTKQDQNMMLTLGGTVGGTVYQSHEIFYILNKNDQVVWFVAMPPQTTEWQKPEWSSQADYASAVALRSGQYNTYLVKISNKSILRVLDGSNSYSHLWVQDQGDGIEKAALPANHSELAISPNPFAETVTFSLTQPLGAKNQPRFQIYNLQGKLVQTLTPPGGESILVQWSPPALAPGLYLVKYMVGQRVFTRKFLHN
jgi:hypothetical protein